MSLKIELYIQPRPVEWLRDHPGEMWRCDIYPSDFRTDHHHAVGPTADVALLRAAQHYHGYELKRKGKTE